jgi:chemosensory pili system protein ChpE
MNSLTLLITAFALGLVFNATPGPVFALTIRQGARGGFRLALAVQLGSLVGDVVWAVIGLVGVGLLIQLDSLRTPISIAGVTYLIWLAWEAWRASRGEFVVCATDEQVDRRGAFRAGAFLSLTNPQHIAYWAAMGSALAGLGVRAPTVADTAVFFLGFMTSSLVWTFLFAVFVDRVFRRVGARWARVTYRACAVAFLALALSMLRELWVSHESTTKPLNTITSDLPR